MGENVMKKIEVLEIKLWDSVTEHSRYFVQSHITVRESTKTFSSFKNQKKENNDAIQLGLYCLYIN